MTKEKYDRAREIKSIQNCLEKLHSAICLPHPKIIDPSDDIVCFISLGDKYEKELKDLMHNFIVEKNKELNQEFEQL